MVYLLCVGYSVFYSWNYFQRIKGSCWFWVHGIGLYINLFRIVFLSNKITWINYYHCYIKNHERIQVLIKGFKKMNGTVFFLNKFAFYSNWCNIILTFDIFTHDSSSKIRGLDYYQKMYISNGLDKVLVFLTVILKLYDELIV